MAIFASTTLGSSDPSKAMSIKALEARAQALAAAQAKQEVPASMPSPWQGASHVFNQAADAFATKRADQATAAGRQDLANVMGQAGDNPNPQQLAQITMRDPEIGKTYMAEIAQRRQQAAQIQAQKEAAATAAQTAETAAVAQEGRVAGRPKTDIAQINADAAAGKMSEDERVAAIKKFTAPPIGEQKYITSMQEESVAGQALMKSLDDAEVLLNDPKGIHAGPQAGNTQTIGENVPGFIQRNIPGVLPDPKTTENTQRYNQIMGAQALELLTKMKGASSDRDVQINFKIVNDPNATLDNKKTALRAMRARIATLLQLHNDTITGAGGKVPTLQSEAPAAPAAGGPAAAAPAGGGDANAEARAWLAANPNDPRAAAVRQKLGGG